MIIGIEFDTKEFERAMREISSESDRTDFEIITMNARTYVRSIAYATPRDSGATRAGFWPAWEALDLPGSPYTRRSMTPFGARHMNSKRTYVPGGRVRDDRRKRGTDCQFEFVNKTYFIDNCGKKVYYPYVLNAQTDFWGKGAANAAFKFGKGYERLLKKHSKI